jgi:ABC-2 type transport system ATP-binding protein
VFLDEPTSGVDPVSRFRFWRLVEALAAGGTTALVTTHYLQEANYCDRLGLMHEGALIALGDIAALRAALPGGGSEKVEDLFVAYIERERAASAAEAAA